MDTDVSHEVEKRLTRIEEHLGLDREENENGEDGEDGEEEHPDNEQTGVL